MATDDLSLPDVRSSLPALNMKDLATPKRVAISKLHWLVVKMTRTACLFISYIKSEAAVLGLKCKIDYTDAV